MALSRKNKENLTEIREGICQNVYLRGFYGNVPGIEQCVAELEKEISKLQSKVSFFKDEIQNADSKKLQAETRIRDLEAEEAKIISDRAPKVKKTKYEILLENILSLRETNPGKFEELCADISQKQEG